MYLPQIQVSINDMEWKKLIKDVWSEKYVNGYLVDNGIREPIQLRYRGGHTRNYPKKSFEVLLGSETIHFNAEYDDPSAIRNALSFQFFNWIGVPSPRTQHCILVLNGINWGVYLQIEGVKSSFFERRNIPFESLIYAVNDDADFSLISPDTYKRKHSLFDGYELVIGEAFERERLKSFIYKINILKNNELTQFLSAHLDIDNYLLWLAGAVYTGNYDGFDQNYAIYICKSKHLYRMIPWDYEGTWGRNCYGKPCSSKMVSIKGYNILTKKLLSRKNIRKKYREILAEILETSFTVERLEPGISHLFESIAPYINADKTRKWPLSVFKQEQRFILSYIKNRKKIIRKAISSNLW